jgi:DedD protein
MIDSNDIHSTDATASTEMDRLRRQARQRFVGAGVLVLIAVIGLPFLLDSKPRPVPVDMQIDIAKAPAPALITPASAPEQPLPVVASQPVIEAPVPAASAPEVAAPAPVAIPATATPAATPAARTTPDDGARAAALLNGQALARGYTIQAGSFIDKNKLHEAQAKLDKAGLQHYTQDATAKNGTPRTRLRLGPFATQQEANSAAVRINKLGLKTIVLTP